MQILVDARCQEVPDINAHVERRLAADLGFKVCRQEPIQPWQAHNNQLLHVWSADGREAVVKIYFRDDRDRLDREYSAVAFLRTRGIIEVPRPLLRDDANGFGVYSFEPGATTDGAGLSEATVERIAEFAARLHHIHPGSEHFRPSVPATFSFADQVKGIRRRLEAFSTHYTEPHWVAAVEALIFQALDGVEDEPVLRDQWAFSTGDFAPHNILVAEDGRICVVDLEYSGWDDPLIPCADFLSAETSTSLSVSCADAFFETYRRAARLSPSEEARLRRVRALMEIGWVAVHLSLLTPERIAPKRFADPAFDLDAHLQHHRARASARLARARELVPHLI